MYGAACCQLSLTSNMPQTKTKLLLRISTSRIKLESLKISALLEGLTSRKKKQNSHTCSCAVRQSLGFIENLIRFCTPSQNSTTYNAERAVDPAMWLHCWDIPSRPATIY